MDKGFAKIVRLGEMGGFIPRVLDKDQNPCAYVFPRAIRKSERRSSWNYSWSRSQRGREKRLAENVKRLMGISYERI